MQDAAGWREMLDEALQQTGGPLTKAEREWADSIIAPPQSKNAAKKGRRDGNHV